MTAPGHEYPDGQPQPHPAGQDPAGPPIEEPQVIELRDTGRSGGMVKCTSCGSTDIRYSIEAGA
ncbi:MAG: hypothetical protein Q4D79_13325, partial [Propionibacteriaceae bacterium]|nr:hypothetical protein [Propionibacteriaceae bacterium]